MKSGSMARALSACVLASLVTAGGGQDQVALAYPAQPAAVPTVADVRQMVVDARKEIDGYQGASGAAGAPDHPAIKAIKWSAAVWDLHDRAPNSDAGPVAAIEAIRLLHRSMLWDRAHARVESLGADDPAWQRVATAVYEEGIARKSFDYTLATLSRTIASTKTASNKAAALLVIGRVHRRQGDLAAATRTLEEARAAAPGTPQAEEADGLLYEIAHLSVGLPAPAVSGTLRNARRAITLDSFRGKPVVLVFWSTTCPSCMEELPILKTLNARYAKDAVILGISVDVSLDRLDRTIKAHGMTWPQLGEGKGFDGAIPTAYRIQGTPELFVLDRAGRIFAKVGSATQLEDRLKEALAQPSPR